MWQRLAAPGAGAGHMQMCVASLIQRGHGVRLGLHLILSIYLI